VPLRRGFGQKKFLPKVQFDISKQYTTRTHITSRILQCAFCTRPVPTIPPAKIVIEQANNMSSTNPTSNQPQHDEDDIDVHDVDNTLDAEEADEIVEDDGDVPMDSDDEGDEGRQ
jgi:hypothetical protein